MLQIFESESHQSARDREGVKMHGRLKIKTTAQQEAEKKKERAVKLGKHCSDGNF